MEEDIKEELELDDDLKKIETYEQLKEWEDEETLKIRQIHSNYHKKIKKVKKEAIYSAIFAVMLELISDYIMYIVIRGFEDVKDPHVIATIFWGLLFSLLKGAKYFFLKTIFIREANDINELKTKEEDATDPVFDEYYQKKCQLEHMVYKKMKEKNS